VHLDRLEHDRYRILHEQNGGRTNAYTPDYLISSSNSSLLGA
jgi:hypothetical protein